MWYNKPVELSPIHGGYGKDTVIMKTLKMKKRNWLALLLAGCMTVGSMGGLSVSVAAEEQTLTYEEKKAAYREQIQADDVTADDFIIGCWTPVYSTNIHSYEYQLDQMADLGINMNIHPLGSWSIQNAEFWDYVEAEYGKRNMTYLMWGQWNEYIRDKAVQYAAGKEHCIGYYLGDEPSGDLIPPVGDEVRAYAAADPERFPYVNLLPSYAGETRLGGTYREHVENFVAAAGAENIEYLSHDYYAFRSSGVVTDIYADVEILRSVAYENGKLKTHAFPQSTAWSGMRMPTADELRWNVYLYLAYGFKALSWFTLVCPGNSDTEGEGFYDGIIYRDGTIRDPELYEAFKELNWEVRGLSSILMNLDAAHAYHVKANANGVEKLPEDFFLQPANRNDFVISVMEPKEGEDQYIMIFNKNNRRDVDGAFTVDAASGVQWVEYFDPFIGEYIPMEFTDGKLNDSYLPGEGKLYRLRYDTPPSETEVPTETAAEVPTEPATEDAATDTASETTDGPTADGGCASVVGCGSAAILVAAAAFVACKKKEE